MTLKNGIIIKTKKKRFQSKKKTKRIKNRNFTGGTGPGFLSRVFGKKTESGSIILGPTFIGTASDLIDSIKNNETVTKYWEISPEKVFSENVCKYTVFKCKCPNYTHLHIIAFYDADKNKKPWFINNGFTFVESIAKFFGTSPVKNESFGSRKEFIVDYFSTCANASADSNWLYSKVKDFTGKNALRDVTTGARLSGGTDGRKPEYDLFSKYKGIFFIYDNISKTFKQHTESEYIVVNETGEEINTSLMTDEEKGNLTNIKSFRVNHACGKSNVFGFTTLKSLFADIVESLNFKILNFNPSGPTGDTCLDTSVKLQKENAAQLDKFLSRHSLLHRLFIGNPEPFMEDAPPSSSTVKTANKPKPITITVNGVEITCDNVFDKLIWEAFDTGLATK
jgi:hypothetical protein